MGQAISIGLFVFFFVTSIFYKSGTESDRKLRRIKSLEIREYNTFDEEMNRTFYKRIIIPITDSFFKSFKKLVPNLNAKKNKLANAKGTNNQTDKLRRDLKAAGLKISTNEFNAIRLIVAFGSIFLSILGSFLIAKPTITILIVVIGSITAYLVPRYYLQSKVKKRQDAILKQMPDVMDILSVSVEAGLGFDAALIRTSEYFQGPLVDELVITYREIQMGKSKKDALRGLSERNIVPALKTFSSTVIQSEKLGIPIKNVLKSQAEQLRTERKQIAEEKGMKTPVKIIIPMILFVFPVIFIILLGPTIIQVMAQFSK
ncbi:MAG: Type secretion system domain protein [Bacillales bacterium]|jgi:tight adherence protein C|nr:Type secretion system domain protein [Bacillales bacterium]